MPAWFDEKYGKWRYRKRVELPDGRRVRVKGTPTVNTKKAAEHAERVAIHLKENPSAAQATPAIPEEEVPTIEEYNEPFLAGYAAEDKPSELASKRRILAAYINPRFGERRLDDIPQEDIDRMRGALLSGKAARFADGWVPASRSGKPRSRKTVNNILAVLSSLLQYAATNKRRPPVELSFVIDEDEAELVALEPGQVDALVAASADPRYRAAILLGADAGLRIGEIRGLEWDCVDELRRRIVVAKSIDPANNVGATKNRKRRRVKTTPRLWEALRLLPRGSRAVVPGPKGQALGYYALREGLLAIYARADVTPPPKPWHCLRHTFCTELAKAGVPVHVIMRLAGHESIETTLKYVHATERDLDAAVEVLAGTFGPELGPEETADSTESVKRK